jgi:hypothetical protein
MLRPDYRCTWCLKLGAGMLRWIFFEPLRNAWHFLLESSRDGEVENPCSSIAPVFEVVSYPARYENKRAFGSVSPALSD